MTTVEVCREDSLIASMAEMRDWLNAQRIAPDLFRYEANEGVVVYQVAFQSENDATAFAMAFDGRIATNQKDVTA